MIDLPVDLSATTSTSALLRRERDRIVIVGPRYDAPTSLNFNLLFGNTNSELVSATYRSSPLDSQETIQVEPISLYRLSAPLRYIGQGQQPPIDDEDYVFFDE